MEPTLDQGNIVLAAPNHRPDIVSKEWLNQKDILKEEPTNFLHRQNRSLVETANYAIDVVQQRITIAARNSNQDTLNQLQTIANQYIDVLPNLSYYAVGLNSNWILPLHPDRLKETFVTNQEKFNKVFHDKTDYNIGGIVSFQYNSFQVQLVITPQQDDQVIADFNYHSNINGLKQLRERISCFFKATEHARDTISNLLGD